MIEIDRAIAEIAGALGPEDSLLVVSDHGFQATEDSVLDVAPLLAYLAGAAIPDELEGSLPEHWIRPEYLAAHPVLRARAADLPRLPAFEGPTAPGDDRELIERLRSMGYLE